MLQSHIAVLEKYMHKDAAGTIAEWIIKSACSFRITKSRSSKFGDYRAPYGSLGHRISVNHDLNPHAFLITTIHEFAHLETWNAHQHRVKPHGPEWKMRFQELMLPFFEKTIFPPDVELAIRSYIQNPKASSCTDIHLFRTLKSYDQKKENHYTVETIPAKAVFLIKDGREFVKGERLRKRYRCVEVKTRRVYLFSPLAEVELLTQ